jgi:hypothetical protein
MIMGCATLNADQPVERASGGGWYSGYYYPGTGVYVYDRWGRSRLWRDHERAFWTAQRKREPAR